jgi:hypothetical protein
MSSLQEHIERDIRAQAAAKAAEKAAASINHLGHSASVAAATLEDLAQHYHIVDGRWIPLKDISEEDRGNN